MRIYGKKTNRRRVMASSNDPTTTNLADFGMREIAELRDILTAWLDYGLPDDFYEDGVTPMLNRNSGNVFLTNSDYQVAMLADGRLESWYFTPYAGHEGFLEDLVDDYRSYPDNWDEEDIEYLRDLGADI